MTLPTNRWFATTFILAGFVAGSFVTATMMRPATARAASNQVFEMRTYTTLEGRLPALEKRFRDHTMTLFEKHGMKNVGYWIPQDAPKHANTLIYIISHESREGAKAAWSAFGKDPEWKKVSDASQVDGKIVQSVESVFMDPTDYSPVK